MLSHEKNNQNMNAALYKYNIANSSLLITNARLNY